MIHRRSVLSTPLLVMPAMVPMRARARDAHPIVGTWNLLSLYDETNGEEVDVFGPNPKGRLSLDNAQFFSFIIFTSTPLTSPRCSHSIAPMTRDAVGPGTIAYYGSYTLHAHDAVSFRIEHGVTAGWKHSDREAHFDLEDNKLNLVSTFSSLTGSDYSHLQWERICG
jgi:Lipocalin-like domain